MPEVVPDAPPVVDPVVPSGIVPIAPPEVDPADPSGDVPIEPVVPVSPPVPIPPPVVYPEDPLEDEPMELSEPDVPAAPWPPFCLSEQATCNAATERINTLNNLFMEPPLKLNGNKLTLRRVPIQLVSI